ncbi:hypothetical protein GOV14_05790 [Candidatus Pacearchaeota archaeon]|nr:hypothetical protein [Candidatus Pacearchaeota archaeon]
MAKKKDNKKLERRFKKEWRNILFNAVYAFVSVLFVVLFFKDILLTTILIGVVSVVGFFKWNSRRTVVIWIFGALWGPVCEMIAIYFGAWQYTVYNVINIPFWLFFLWGNAAAFLYQTAREVKRLGVKDN